MIYPVLKKITQLGLYVFFRRIVVTGKENRPEQGPMLIVANHPNTFMDPLVIASILGQRVGFVSKATIFSGKILSAILSYLHVIPIIRKKDLEQGEQPDNNDAFLMCHQYLGQGGSLLIFPEGNSYYELALRQIKTGTARIALSFAALSNFESGLLILPVSLDYSDSIQFRSSISVTIGAPLAVDDDMERYLSNEFEGVTALTEDIRKSLAKNIPQTNGKEQELFLIRAHRFYTTFYESGADLYRNPRRSFELRSQLSLVLKKLEDSNIGLYTEIQNGILKFYQEVKSLGLTIGFFTDEFNSRNAWSIYARYLFIFILLLPVYLFGLVTNYLPYRIPTLLFEKLKIDIEYKTSVALVAGMITFPLFYFLEIMLIRHFIGIDLWEAFLLLALFPISGYVTMYYWTEIKRSVRLMRFIFFTKKERKRKIMHLRSDIMDRIEEAKGILS